ncbi:hypothetical protein BaRGS_00002036 [Batillaria attramentaria]|uniref:Uncharacterized protein n=1 Tax=Batillaria attramentaria TaxID=370345 RepID=A0ABD0M447_9CAEN
MSLARKSAQAEVHTVFSPWVSLPSADVSHVPFPYHCLQTQPPHSRSHRRGQVVARRAKVGEDVKLSRRSLRQSFHPRPQTRRLEGGGRSTEAHTRVALGKRCDSRMSHLVVCHINENEAPKGDSLCTISSAES